MNSIHRKIIRIPDYHDISKETINIRIENLLKNGRVRNTSNRGNQSFTLTNVTIEIPIHDDSYYISHNSQISNNSPITTTMPETQN